MKAKNMKEWHNMVCERDGYICQACGTDYSCGCYFDDETGRNNHVCGHHKDTQGAHPELRLETDVGECVDLNCHTLIHSGMSKEQIRKLKHKKVETQQKKKTEKYWGVTKPPEKRKNEKYWGASKPVTKNKPRAAPAKKKKGKSIQLDCYYDKKTGKLIKLNNKK